MCVYVRLALHTLWANRMDLDVVGRARGKWRCAFTGAIQIYIYSIYILENDEIQYATTFKGLFTRCGLCVRDDDATISRLRWGYIAMCCMMMMVMRKGCAIYMMSGGVCGVVWSI